MDGARHRGHAMPARFASPVDARARAARMIAPHAMCADVIAAGAGAAPDRLDGGFQPPARTWDNTVRCDMFIARDRCVTHTARFDRRDISNAHAAIA